ncbi:hypothetical protein FSP39_002005 [Pinctada imbricata]|uniref:PKD domain-containing protein n=1 Tax=Pinctada imbricata TaxID=66713 RepID=A0AA89CBE6_PINIB|nr:hypothetical protein FSP39_002005 [Pinctada imbricata]
MLVVSSYGNGCDLNIEFSHAFSGEGTYRPEVIVSSEGMTLTSPISSGTITVMNRLAGARIQSDKAVAINNSVEFVLHLTSRSEAMEVTWMIGDTSNGEMLNKTSADTHLHYRFTSSGVYHITVEAKNLISRVRATSHVTVQVPIINAFVSCGHVTYISTGEEIECISDIFEGTDARFEWSFQNPGAGKVAGVRHDELTSVANHTYHRPGQYNISVVVHNEISKATALLPSLLNVLDPITCVAIQSSGPTKFGNPVHFMVTICQGTNVRLEFDFGLGRQKHGYELYDIPGEFYSSYDFKEPGIHDVTIFAYNRVSEVSHTTQVLVQERIPEIKLVTLNKRSVVGEPLTIIATSSGTGKQLEREDLVYTWKFQDGSKVMTSLPFWNGVINQEGRCIVNMTAHNFGNAFPRTLSLFFSILHHVYDNAGHNVVTVDCTDRMATSKTWTSLVLVDVPITGLHIEGPTVVEIEKLLRDYMWKASVSMGTNIVYSWDTGVGVVNNTTLSMFMKGFSKPGVYPITVKAHNSVSHMEASINITVQYPILDTMVTIDPTVLNQSSIVNISVHGGREFSIHIDFGDGTFLRTSSDRLTDTELSTPRRGNYVPEYLVLISHVFPEVKTYEVTVNISNLITSVAKSKMAIVDTPITGIELTTESPEVVSPEDPVVVMVTVKTGNDLSFVWDFSDKYNPDLDIKSTANCSIASHTFSVVGHRYQVSVSISSPYYKEPIMVKLPFKFHVVERIGDVTLEVIGGKSGAPLIGLGPDQSTAEVEFKAVCESGTDVEFLFDFGDGSTSMVAGYEAFPFFHFKGTASHRYDNEGAYNVTVTAINPLGNVTTSLEELFIVQTPSIGLRLEQNEYGTKIGEVTTLRAYHSGGTNVTFDWKLGDQSDVIKDGGPVIHHMYKNPGVYNVVVMLRNQVSNQTDQARVFVQQELQGVHINVSQETRIYAVGDKVEFTASVFPKSATVMYYKWKFDENSDTMQSYGETCSHEYHRYDTYIVTVKAHNLVSQVSSPPFEVTVMSKVRNLQIVFNDNPIVNTTLTFTVFHYHGSDLTYTWDFGDSSGEVVSNNYKDEIKHTYTSIREYFVTLTAENAISKDVTSLHLFVLDRICKSPEVELHGITKDNISRSDSLFIETKINPIQCEYSTRASFLWSIYNESSGEIIQLPSGDRNALQQKNLYLPPWSLLVGKYKIILRVQVKGTIVYTKRNTSMEVLPRLVRAVIKGGLMCEINRQDTVVLDARNTRGCNHDNCSNLSFNWTCSTTLKENKPVYDCFNDNVTESVHMNSSLVHFQANILNNDIKDFLFTLNVREGNRDSKATQVIQLNDVNDQNIKLSIHCAQCDNGLVNAHQHLRLQAICHKCLLADTEFDWSIQMLLEGATDAQNLNNFIDTSCIQKSDGSFFSLNADNDSISTNQNKERSEETTIAQANIQTCCQGAANDQTHCQGAANVQPTAREQPMSPSTAREQPMSSPTARKQPMSKPTAREQPISKPAAREQSMSSPTAREQPMSKPTAREQPMSKPTAREQPMSKPTAREQPMSKPTAREQPMSSRTDREQPMSKPAAREQPMSKPTAREQPMSKPTAREQPMSKAVAREQPMSTSVAREQLMSTFVAREQPMSKPTAREQPMSKAVSREQPMSKPTAREQPMSKSVAREQPMSKPTAREQPMSKAVDREQPMSKPTARELPMSKDVGREQPMSKPTAREQPMSKAIAREQPMSPSTAREQPMSKPTAREQPMSNPLPGSSQCPHPLPGSSQCPHPLPGSSQCPNPLPGSS